MEFWAIYSHFYSLSLRNLLPYRSLLEDLNDTLDIREGENILDAGCGPGLVIERIITRNEARRIGITGVDNDNRMLEHARRRCRNFLNVSIHPADLNSSLEFPGNCFNKVLCSNTLYALESPRSAIAEFYRVLKPGGAVIIANPKPNAREGALIRGHVAVLGQLTPLRRRIRHIVVSILLIPVYLLLIAVNKVIIEKGRSGEYRFLDQENLREILKEVGFGNIQIRSCYADQDWLVRAEK